jgi:hypothetical protein
MFGRKLSAAIVAGLDDVEQTKRQIAPAEAATSFSILVDDRPSFENCQDLQRIGFTNHKPEYVPGFVTVRDTTLVLLRLRLDEAEVALNETVEREYALDSEYGTPMPQRWMPYWQREVNVSN